MNQKHSKTGAMQKETKTYDMKILILKNMFKQDELSLEKVHTPYFRIASKFRARPPQFLIHRPIIMQEDFGSR